MDINELLKKPYLNEKEVAVLTGRALSTLRNERHLRNGFPYLKYQSDQSDTKRKMFLPLWKAGGSALTTMELHNGDRRLLCGNQF